MRKESTRSADLSSRGWAICRPRARNSRFRSLPLPCGARGVKESRKFCWRKQPAAACKKHRIKRAQRHDDRLHHFLLLDCFVLLQRNRKRTAVDRPGAIAAKCETSRAGGRAARSTAETSGAVARDCFAFHKCGGHTRPAPADAPIGPFVGLRRLFNRVGDRASRSISFCFPSSLSRFFDDFLFELWRVLPAYWNCSRSCSHLCSELGARLGRLLLPRRAAKRARLFAAREELKQITTQSEREGSLTATERAMIHNVVDFRGVKVRDVMLPLARVVAVQPNASIRGSTRSQRFFRRRSSSCHYAGRATGWIGQRSRYSSRAKWREQAVEQLCPAYRNYKRGGAGLSDCAAIARGAAWPCGCAGWKEKICGIVTIEDLIRVSFPRAKPEFESLQGRNILIA